MVAQQAITLGDTVRFTLGTTPVTGIVIDDRGPIGANGVRIYRVRVPNSPYDDELFEMAEDELDVQPPPDTDVPKDAIVEYLQHGGLVQILRQNLSGGKSQPRVWLRRDTAGNVVHTFTEAPGAVGGATVPFAALRANRIFAPKRGDVLAFLKTFGLSGDDANRVIDAVGTAS